MKCDKLYFHNYEIFYEVKINIVTFLFMLFTQVVLRKMYLSYKISKLRF